MGKIPDLMSTRTSPRAWILLFAAAAVLSIAIYHTALGIGFAQDDWIVLSHVLESPGGPRTPLPLWRPLEDLIALASIDSGFPAYKFVSILAHAALVTVSLRIALRYWGPVAATVTGLFVLAAPLNAIVMYEIDTVSQVLGSLSCLLLFDRMLKSMQLQEPVSTPGPMASAGFASLCLLALISKETSFGLVAMPIGLVLCIRMFPPFRRALGAVPVNLAIIAAITLTFTLLIRVGYIPGSGFSTSSDPAYELRLSPLKWVANAAMLMFGNLIGSPSSRLMGDPRHLNGVDLASLIVSLCADIGLAILAARQWRRSSGIRFKVLVLVAMYWIASIFPAVIYHASEIYVYQGLPYLAILCGAAASRIVEGRPLLIGFAVGLGLACLAGDIHANQVNGSMLDTVYRHSETRRCELGLAPDCRDLATHTAIPANNNCFISDLEWVARRGMPRRPYGLYYGPVEEYFTDSLMKPPLQFDARRRIPSCTTGPAVTAMP